MLLNTLRTFYTEAISFNCLTSHILILDLSQLVNVVLSVTLNRTHITTLGMDLANHSEKEAHPVNHFLSLPRELRDAIYELCIFDPLAIDMVYGEHPEWLLTSKQIFHEAAPIVCSKGCLHITTGLRGTELLDQLWKGYATSMSDRRFGSVKDQTFEQMKLMISNIAITVYLTMNVSEITLLSENYLSRLDELPNLKNLYINLHPIAGREFSQFRQQLSSSDLRIFQVVSFVKPVESLLARKPSGCTIHWTIPESVKLAIDCEAIRLGAAAGEQIYYQRLGNRPDIAEFMTEVEAAVAATVPQADSVVS